MYNELFTDCDNASLAVARLCTDELYGAHFCSLYRVAPVVAQIVRPPRAMWPFFSLYEHDANVYRVGNTKNKNLVFRVYRYKHECLKPKHAANMNNWKINMIVYILDLFSLPAVSSLY